jgi:hypothetical protein
MDVQVSRPVGLGALSLAFLAVASAPAATIVIDFDQDPAGNAIVAPVLFRDATPLTGEYAALGVTFAGPTAISGGAILDQDSNFGVSASSGMNFLAFNPDSQLANGGVPSGPETLLFNPPVMEVSVLGGGKDPVTLQMQAFDAQGVLIVSDTQTTRQNSYERLRVTGREIHRVVLQRLEGDTLWVFDDLTFVHIPEPPTWWGCCLAAWGLALACRRSSPG